MTRHRVDRSADLKTRIRGAAEDLFSTAGYASTSVRDIATAAGVDPSIVIRHFGSKESLFVETVRLHINERNVLSGPLDTVGRRVVQKIFTNPEELVRSRGAFAALLRATDNPDVRSLLTRELSASLITPIESRLPGPKARLRAHIFSAQLIGLFTALWVIEDPVLVNAAPEDLAAAYGHLLQSALTGALPAEPAENVTRAGAPPAA
ncbi:hypothetical protein ASF40_20495 [Microbacterium sp. Leaf288]|uniref:TetR/AcrR family transcriptional regulator n=1 Tax=Microbacterium sp. Leaf288 TaxID=1736323 RepID=UPI0006FFE811|nr:TetR family transcriptional regulator [Microbacterium sp. Leaf288]KQP73223.1 hypothetical protein ASF40_20495 [Microbacterium sp. Leaf288]